MILPESFADMPRESAKRKFPHEDRPKVIISSDDFRVCFAFNTIEIQHESIDDRVSAFRAYMKTIHPSNVFFTEGVYDLSNKMQVGYYDYQHPSNDGDIYNITFVTDLLDIELLGWFICPAEVKDKWEPLARQMIQSIEMAGEVLDND